MDGYNEYPYYSYSWHQATVLLMVPYETQDEDVVVVIERNYLVVGVRGESPTVKGRLYGNIDITNSLWQLEPRSSRLSARERTTSTTSTASTHSSYAFVSDPEISSSFAASLESGQVSEVEDLTSPRYASPALHSEEQPFALRKRKAHSSTAASRSVSPGHLRSITSSYSSLESLHPPPSGKLLTLHLEKDQSIIWPSLIVGPVPETLSPHLANSVVFNSSHELEHQYNMDPTSLVLIALELFDIRKDKEEAFEFFLRAWHQAHVPSATIRLVTHYFPFKLTRNFEETDIPPARGTLAYYHQCIGGFRGLALLYRDAGMLHLEGSASSLLSSSYSSLSSIRMPLHSRVIEGGAQAWRRDREIAGRYFEQAHSLCPELPIPPLPLEADIYNGHEGQELEMPSIDKKDEMALINNRQVKLDELDNSWYFYIPGLVGAGTALLVVGIVGH
ncbi:hypothetical protein BD779DRAFT_1494956 [Infundibulicybe gibba]|nr:hypothetical protein BD779DRAFT_1494956 [Infundibulicybe gibba]